MPYVLPCLAMPIGFNIKHIFIPIILCNQKEEKPLYEAAKQTGSKICMDAG
jgi:hypothetical protein